MSKEFDHVKDNLSIRQAIAALTNEDPGDKKLIRCPFPDHEDKRPSFHISKDGKTFYCGSCPTKSDGHSVIDLIMKFHRINQIEACKLGYAILGETFPSNGNGNHKKASETPATKSKPKEDAKPVSPKDKDKPKKYADLKNISFDQARYNREKAECADFYEYPTPDGKPHMQVFRKYTPDGLKYFPQWTWNGSHYVPYCPEDTPKYLYRADKLKDAGVVFLVEGEKDVHSLEKLGLVATTWSGGAKALKGHCDKWDILAALAGKDVYFIPDNDPSGQDAFQAALPFLLGRVDALRKVKLPDLPEKGDVSDFIVINKDNPNIKDLILGISLNTPLYLPNLDSEYVFLSTAALEKFKWPPPEWVVEPIIPVGLTILAGAPKARKSGFAHQLGVMTANGVDSFGPLTISEGAVLHLSQEEDPQWWNLRLSKILTGPDGEEPRPDKLYVAFRIDPELGLHGQIRLWTRIIPKLKLIFIDTLQTSLDFKDQQRLMGRSPDGGYGAWTEILTPLRRLAKELKIAIVVVHHASGKGRQTEDKFAGILGSTALTAIPDSMVVIEKVFKKEYQGTLSYRGRQTADGNLALTYHNESFTFGVLGDLDTLNVNQTEQAVIDELEARMKPTKLEDLRSECGGDMTQNAFKAMVKRLVEKGRIDKCAAWGMYQAKPHTLQ